MSAPRGRPLVKRFLRDQRGASAVEFAISGAILIFISLGVIEFGRALLIRNEIAFAADQATRVVLMNPSASVSTITTTARNAIQGNKSLLSVSVADQTVDGLPSRVITLSYPVKLLLPVLSTSGFNISVARRVSKGQ